MSPGFRLSQKESNRRIGELVLDRYRLEALLGVGGVGVVYRALDTETGALVAVKFIRDEIDRVPTAAARFLREARIANTLDHPAIPRGIATGVSANGSPVVVIEFVPGRNFAEILEKDGPLRVPDALRLGSRVAEALEVAHARSIVHRDIKPANIMLLDGAGIPNGVMVLDFGVAFCLDEPRLSTADSFYGSPFYMSPEQARGEVVSPQSDIYSLGAMLYHLLTGRTLYDGIFLHQVESHVRAPIPDVREARPDVPQSVADYLVFMLQKEPSRRPTTAAEVAISLRRLASAADGEASVIEDFSMFVDAEPEGEEGLLEEYRDCSERLQRLIAVAGSAHGRIVQQIVQVTARRLECQALSADRDDKVAKGDSAGAAAIEDLIDDLGDVEEAFTREAALESALAELQRQAHAEQQDLRDRLARLQERIVGGDT